MKWTTLGKASGLIAGTVILGLLAGCRVHVDKGANGEEKTVQVDTPFGAPSDVYARGRLGDVEVFFLPRHGRGHPQRSQ